MMIVAQGPIFNSSHSPAEELDFCSSGGLLTSRQVSNFVKVSLGKYGSGVMWSRVAEWMIASGVGYDDRAGNEDITMGGEGSD